MLKNELAGVAELPQASNINGCDSAGAISDPAETPVFPPQCRTFLSRDEVLNRLELLASTKPGDPIPDFLNTSNTWGGELSALAARAAEEIKEQDESFELRWNADMRAIKRWQAEKPGRDLTWPDHADLVVWLMARIEPDAADVDRRLHDALSEAGRSALGMPSSVDAFKAWLHANGLTLVLA